MLSQESCEFERSNVGMCEIVIELSDRALSRLSATGVTKLRFVLVISTRLTISMQAPSDPHVPVASTRRTHGSDKIDGLLVPQRQWRGYMPHGGPGTVMVIW